MASLLCTLPICIDVPHENAWESNGISIFYEFELPVVFIYERKSWDLIIDTVQDVNENLFHVLIIEDIRYFFFDSLTDFLAKFL